MAASKPVLLCTLTMPNGQRCGSPALRGKRFCYHHSRTERISERERHFQQRLGRIVTQIEAMNTSQLLHFLFEKLEPMQKTLKRFPDAYCALIAALERVHEISEMESESKRQMRLNEQLLSHIQQIQMTSIMYKQGLRIQSVIQKA